MWTHFVQLIRRKLRIPNTGTVACIQHPFEILVTDCHYIRVRTMFGEHDAQLRLRVIFDGLDGSRRPGRCQLLPVSVEAGRARPVAFLPDARDSNSQTGARIMRNELADSEWVAIKPMPPNKPRGIPRVNDRRILRGIFWVLRPGGCVPGPNLVLCGDLSGI